MADARAAASEALELLRGELEPRDDPSELALAHLVLGLIFIELARGRGVGLGDGLQARLRRPGGDAWAGVLGLFAELHRERGGWLFAKARLAPLAGQRVADAGVRAAVERLAAFADPALELEVLGQVYEATRSIAARRRTSTHYTPRTLADEIVARSLEPHLRARRPESLVICDPAMGSGAFVLAACRALGARIDHPRGRLIAGLCCVRGVDEDPTAVALARLSLWLEVGAPDLGFDCFDHALRHGDALVGLSLDQLRRLDWGEAPPRADATALVDQALARRPRLAASIEALASDPNPAAIQRNTARWREEMASLAPLRNLGDRVIEAFSCSTRTRERSQALRALHRELDEPGVAAPARGVLRALHWPLEFPHVQGFDAFVGNPPFAGKNGLIARRGRAYLDWLKHVHPGSHGNADYAAHFFRRADALLGPRGGTIGFVATNTIGQGDTRATGLAALVAAGAEIYDAREHLEWPGVASVTVSVVHLARGPSMQPDALTKRRLNGRIVAQIDSRLRPRPERADPAALVENAGRAFIGTYVLGRGFVLTPAQRDALVARDPRNAAHIRAYLGGKELNRSPTQAASRCVIDFGELPLAHAEQFPDLLDILRREVRPGREALADNPDGRRRKAHWWQHGRVTPSLQAALEPLSRCLVTSLVSKHLVFAFAPADQLFSHKLCVFPLSDDADFAVLQSRVHAIWARLHSSTMRNAGLNYSPSDCFETFPWPWTQGAVREDLDCAGHALDEARRRFMTAAGVGLTETYNSLADRDRDDPVISGLRELHVDLDRAVLAAYGWADLDAPVYLDADPCFEDAVIDRLHALNEARDSLGS